MRRLLLFSMLWAAGVSQYTNSCYATGLLPTTRFHLPFCGDIFPESSCCPTQADLQNRETYSSLTATGIASCGPSDPVVHRSMHEVREFLCLPCDPDEPKYRFLQVDGDLHYGGQAPPNPEANDGEWGWRVCKSFVFGKDGQSGVWGLDGSKFDQCGYSAAECKNVIFLEYSNTTNSWLRHEPGPCNFPNNGGPVFPASFYSGTALQKAVQMLQDVWSALDGFSFYIIDDHDPQYKFEAAPCFGRNEAMIPSMWLPRLGLVACVCILILL